MPARSEPEAIHQMLEYAQEAVGMLAARSKEDLRVDYLRDLALQQLISMIGCAARTVSAEGRARLPEIPWERTIAMGDRMLQDYDTVDYAVVWTHVTDEMPRLIAALQRVRSKHPL
ncbi:MAG TPA: HepT-like ribonuclease domain-containing protein [Methylomirabilota bacterium]